MALPADALAAWSRRQAAILDRHYDLAWQRGVNAYQPLQESAVAEHPARDSTALALLVRRRKVIMDEQHKRAALAPALASISKMAGQLSGAATAADEPSAQAVVDYGSANTWRQNLGSSVVWAGSIAGFAQAASVDSKLLTWTAEGAGSCDDCVYYSGLDAMPLEQWPTLPGEGATVCQAGCRCGMDAV